MIVMNCVCGYRMEAGEKDELYAELRAHTDEAHGDLNVSEEDLRRVIDAHRQMEPWDGATRTLSAPPEIRPLSPERAEDFIEYFDRRAFMDNPMWAGCYCMFQHVAPGSDWEQRPPERNREDKIALIRRGEAHGFLAYDDDGKAVAWCHAAPRESLPRIQADENFAVDGETGGIGSIVCFVVSAPYRRQGLARLLLDAACDGLRQQGMTIAEAYPHPGGSASDAHSFFGPLSMYEDAGFTVYREHERNIVVWKPLT